MPEKYCRAASRRVHIKNDQRISIFASRTDTLNNTADAFRGAAVSLGLGNCRSIPARQALKMTLMLTQADGCGYFAADTRTFHEAHPTHLPQMLAGLAEFSRPSPFDTLCVYLAGDIESQDGELAIRHTRSAQPPCPLAAVATALQAVKASTLILLMDGWNHSPEWPTSIAERLLEQLTAGRESVAVHTALLDGRASPTGPLRAASALERPRTLSEFFIEWCVGRDTTADAPINIQSLNDSLPPQPEFHLESALWQSEQAERREAHGRIGNRFPWLVWNQRTTIPGHVVTSLNSFVEEHAGTIHDRIEDGVLNSATLAGLPASLFISLWREAQHTGKAAPELLQRLERDRHVVCDALLSNNLNRSATAAAMGISRSTLYAKMRRLNIRLDELRQKASMKHAGHRILREG